MVNFSGKRGCGKTTNLMNVMNIMVNSGEEVVLVTYSKASADLYYEKGLDRRVVVTTAKDYKKDLIGRSRAKIFIDETENFLNQLFEPNNVVAITTNEEYEIKLK